MRQRDGIKDRKEPIIIQQLVKTLIVESCHELGVCRFAVRIFHRESPLFLLSRCQSVAEGLPFQLQFLVGLWTGYRHCVTVNHPLLHPCKGQEDTVTIFFPVGQLAVDEFVALVNGTAFQHFIS